MALHAIEVPYRNNYDFGIGVDLASGSPMNKVVQGEITGVEYAFGSQASWRLLRIQTTSELESKLGVDAEANYGSGLFGPSISARFHFAKDRKIQSSSLFMAAYASVTLRNLSIDEPTLTPHASEIAGRTDVFTTRYGNMFVRGVSRGGLFMGIIQIDTSSAEASDSIAAELKGSYGLFSAEAKVKLDNLNREHRSEISIEIYHEGGPIDLSMRDPHNPSELYELLQRWLSSFQSAPDANAVPYYVQLAPISIAEGPIPPNAAQIEHAQDILIICARHRSAILDGINLMDYIGQRPSRYDFPAAAPTTPADITQTSANYQADLDLVAEAASQAMNDVTKAKTPVEYAREHSMRYPQGIPPTPMPTLRPGATPPPQPSEVLNHLRGAWNNTNPEGLIKSMRIVPTDDKHARVTAIYETFGEQVVNADWDDESQELKGRTSMLGPSSIFDGHSVRLVVESSFTIFNPSEGATQTLVVSNVQGPRHASEVHGPFDSPPPPPHIDNFQGVGM